MTLQLAIARAAQQSPSTLAIRGKGFDRTWSETADRVARIATGLRALKLDAGDRLGIVAHNSAACLEVTYAAVWAGIVVVPINYRLSVPEMAGIMADSGALGLIHDETTASQAAELVSQLPLHLASLAPGGDMARLLAADPMPVDAPDPGGLFGLYYTGGTTGRPKGVELSHLAMHLTALDQLVGMEITPETVFLVAPPLFHMAGFTTANSVTYQQACHVFSDDLSPTGIVAAIERYGVNFLSVVPTVYRSLIDAAGADPVLRRVTSIVYGAAPASETLLRDLLAAFPNARLKQAYGQTEVAGACAILPPEVHVPGHPRLSSAGKATASVHLRIVDARGHEAPRGTAGEVCVAGPRVMRGYWGQPRQTAATLVNGWLHTGDVGIMDDEGFVSIVDRLKDMIVSGGENVFCGEVEAVLIRHPDVTAVAVVGVPDALWGEAVHAYVVLATHARPDTAGLIRHARRELGGYKVPKGITLVDALPLSGLGKVRKNALRQIWLDAHAKPDLTKWEE